MTSHLLCIREGCQRTRTWHGAHSMTQGLSPAIAAPVTTRYLSPVLQVNPRYAPQLQTVLTWPHSIGIVGGRPSSSLYFVGYQDDNVLFLDPHETQQVLLITLPPTLSPPYHILVVAVSATVGQIFS